MRGKQDKGLSSPAAPSRGGCWKLESRMGARPMPVDVWLDLMRRVSAKCSRKCKVGVSQWWTRKCQISSSSDPRFGRLLFSLVRVVWQSWFEGRYKVRGSMGQSEGDGGKVRGLLVGDGAHYGTSCL